MGRQRVCEWRGDQTLIKARALDRTTNNREA
jgi:hypothetical protein